MKELIGEKFFLINLLFLTGATFLILVEHEQTEIRAQIEPDFISLNSSSTHIDANNTGVLNNDSLSEDKMQIQICDTSHPC